MVDKKSIKKKSVLQKQKQKQSVVVNINTHKTKSQSRPRKRKPVEKDSETLLEKQQKQLIYPSVIHLSLIHISEPTRLGMISYAVFCLKKKKK